MKILQFILMFTCAAGVFAQPQTKCFRNDGLRDNHTVRFAADGGDVAGSYFVEPDGNAEQAQVFDFSGTRGGNTLTVNFAGEAPPGVAPSKTKSSIWTLAQSAKGELLRIKFYGKNYKTNAYANYKRRNTPVPRGASHPFGPMPATQATRYNPCEAAFAAFRCPSGRMPIWN